MVLPVFTVAELANNKNKPVEFFTGFASEAIDQAAFLVSRLVSIDDIDPDDVKLTKLYKYSVLEVAWHIYVESQYSDILANPFQSEQIGSYSYSKSSTARSLANGDTGGLFWLSMLRDYLNSLNTEGTGPITSGGIVVFEYDAPRVGNRVYGPMDDITFGNGMPSGYRPYM